MCNFIFKLRPTCYKERKKNNDNTIICPHFIYLFHNHLHIVSEHNTSNITYLHQIKIRVNK